ncbi:MAG TPA: sigma-54 dependent transcriptional regulator [Caulobacteraceae bacterium]|jgi:DNA-binding NtrC family response regulator
MPTDSRPGRVLYIDDDADVLTAVRMLLTRHGFEVLTASNPPEGLALLGAAAVDAVLLDLNFSRGATTGEEGLRALAEILAQDPQATVVVVTAHSGINIAVAAMRAGASDFITKPWSNDRLAATVRTAVELRRQRRRAFSVRAENAALVREAFGGEAAILGSSAVMTRLRTLVARTGPTDANVLILGENGAGKELVGRALHQASKRAAGPFIPVDLGAAPEGEIEAELFGERANPDSGRFAAAHGGTLFLDEIGRLPQALQLKLLSALERGQITPVGGDRPLAIDARIVASSTMPRGQLYSESTLRPDLLYRLNTVEIGLPPLRDRGDDPVELARHFLRHYARRYGRPEKPLSPAAAAALKADPWPGNVRALRHAVERAVILSDGPAYEPGDFPLTERATGTAEATRGGDLNLARSERWLIEQALQRHQYNVSHAAKDLGLTRAALYRRMEKHGL